MVLPDRLTVYAVQFIRIPVVCPVPVYTVLGMPYKKASSESFAAGWQLLFLQLPALAFPGVSACPYSDRLSIGTSHGPAYALPKNNIDCGYRAAVYLPVPSQVCKFRHQHPCCFGVKLAPAYYSGTGRTQFLYPQFHRIYNGCLPPEDRCGKKPGHLWRLHQFFSPPARRPYSGCYRYTAPVQAAKEIYSRQGRTCHTADLLGPV